MYAYCTHGIIDMELQIQHLDDDHHQYARNNSNNDRTQCIQCIASGGNSDQPGQGGVQAHGDIRLSVLFPCINHGGAGSYGRSNGGGKKN